MPPSAMCQEQYQAAWMGPHLSCCTPYACQYNLILDCFLQLNLDRGLGLDWIEVVLFGLVSVGSMQVILRFVDGDVVSGCLVLSPLTWSSLWDREWDENGNGNENPLSLPPSTSVHERRQRQTKHIKTPSNPNSILSLSHHHQQSSPPNNSTTTLLSSSRLTNQPNLQNAC